jgi:hypothetical protein
MKKITSKNLPDKLARYGALSLAIAGISNASGQIVYTDIPDETLAPGEGYVLDLDGDGVDDFSLNVYNGTAPFGVAVIFPGTSSVYNTNGIVGILSAGYTYPSNLTSGAIIDGNSPIVNGERGDLNWNSCNYPNSNFCGGVTDGYIGLQFMVSGNTHYGWVRIDLTADATSMTVKDFAYQSTPNAGIKAGNDGSLSTDNQTIAGFNHFYNSSTKQLTLSANEAFSNISLYNLLGQEVIAKNLSSNNEVIDMSAVKDGVYIGTVNVNGQVATFKIVKR